MHRGVKKARCYNDRMSASSKFKPRKGKRYIVTDQCFWQQLTDEERKAYNPYDKKRAPHGIQLVDAETGTVVNLLSGSIVEIVDAKGSTGK